MFSGIVEEKAIVISLSGTAEGALLSVKSKLDHSNTSVGDSIAIDGVCLTVTQINQGILSFDLAAETLRRATLSALKSGSAVNLERSLKVGSRISGHFVFGHVDGTASVLAIEDQGASKRFELSLPQSAKGFIAPKGSITLSGVSLTVGEVNQDSFSVYIVPHTSEVTTFSHMQVGSLINVEIDMLARYVHSLLELRYEEQSASRITMDFLKEHGFLE